ncbi:MAG: hypothetical protein DME22_16890 [Verrucomicrobia bacterium]|nr:MAG: hypothetical protein DME22_16890 [Verrucomicrobiota bacterium]
MKLITLLQIGGALHLGLAWAGGTMPKVVNLREHLAALPPFIRRLFWVYFTFIGLTLVSFGGLTFFYAPAMASGEPLARALCVFLAAFWILRLIVAVFVFDVRPYLANWFYRLGYYLTTAVFIYLAAIYAWTAFR